MSLAEDLPKIVSTVIAILESKNNNYLADIIKRSKIEINEGNYDNWNGGEQGYILNLHISPELYAKLDGKIESTEKDITEEIRSLTRKYNSEYLQNVIIDPVLLQQDHPGIDTEEFTPLPEIKSPDFWIKGYFRLFFSHSSANKETAATYQAILLKYGISLFVAHNDIEPAREWQNEIELALSTMDSLAALLSKDFPSSLWCDQEIGIAIGKNKLVIPMRFEIDPYGFIGKFQAITVRGKEIEFVCEEIFKILASNPLSAQRMIECLVFKLCNSNSYAESSETSKLLLSTKGNINQELADKLLTAMAQNSQIKDAWGVPERIQNIIKSAGLEITPIKAPDNPDPF
jgi:hypothetical protein